MQKLVMYKQHTLTVKTIQYTISKVDIENCIYFTRSKTHNTYLCFKIIANK